MLSYIRNTLGMVKVEETGKYIKIDGIPTWAMQKGVMRIWKTSRINTYMFKEIKMNSLVIHRFFAVDFVFILEKMIEFKRVGVPARTLNRIKDLMFQNTWLKRTLFPFKSRLDKSQLKQMIWPPKDYQAKFFDDYDQLKERYGLNGYLLAAAAGAGKTFTALSLAAMLKSTRVVVVCPKNATKKVWESEVNTLYKQPESSWVYQDGNPYRGERFVIYHYQAIEKAIADVKKYKTKNTLLILDESHNLNEMNSLQTQRFIELCKKLEPTDIVPMSGTPFKALGSEAVPLLYMLDPMFDAEAERRFKKIYGSDGKRGLDILSHRIGLISFKVGKPELGLKEPIFKEVKVKLKNGQDFTLDAIKEKMRVYIEERFEYYDKRFDKDTARFEQIMAMYDAAPRNAAEEKEYETYKKNLQALRAERNTSTFFNGEVMQFCNTFEKNRIIPKLDPKIVAEYRELKTVIKYVNLKIRGEALGRVLGKIRNDCFTAMGMVIDFQGICETTEKKTVVFSTSVEAIEAVGERLLKEGMEPVLVYGKTTKNLPAIVEQFGKDENINPLCATYQSLSTAVPLVMADVMVLINSPYRSYVREQAISRIHRLGATTQTTIYECVLDTGKVPNISTRNVDILAWSQEMVSLLMGMPQTFKTNVSVEEYGLLED